MKLIEHLMTAWHAIAVLFIAWFFFTLANAALIIFGGMK